jgi:NADPH2:quinone reductase
MRVVWVTRFGGPQVLAVGEAPDPVAGAGEVVIEVAVADVLFLDAQLRSGWGREYFDTKPPYVPGSGVAGQVIATGQGVDPGWVGRRVVAIVPGGGYAERVAAWAEGLAPVPDGLGMPAAAALVQTGPAALSLLDAAHLQRGEWVLVMPAAGGLGSLLVQLAQRAGGRVIAAAGGQRKLQLAGDFGAEVARLAGQVLAEAAAGRLRAVIGRTFPLEAAADAHAAVEARTVLGRTLLLVR